MEAMTSCGAGFPGGGDAQADFFQGSLGFDDHRVGAGAHQGRRLLAEGRQHRFLRHLAGTAPSSRAERADVADHVARPAAPNAAARGARLPAR